MTLTEILQTITHIQLLGGNGGNNNDNYDSADNSDNNCDSDYDD